MPPGQRSNDPSPRIRHNPWAAHARAHLCFEEGDPNAARTFLASWLTTYPRNGALYSHLNWHLALAEKRSPLLSLVKMMKVSRPAGLRCTAAMTRPMPASRICIISP